MTEVTVARRWLPRRRRNGCSEADRLRPPGPSLSELRSWLPAPGSQVSGGRAGFPASLDVHDCLKPGSWECARKEGTPRRRGAANAARPPVLRPRRAAGLRSALWSSGQEVQPDPDTPPPYERLPRAFTRGPLLALPGLGRAGSLSFQVRGSREGPRCTCRCCCKLFSVRPTPPSPKVTRGRA